MARPRALTPDIHQKIKQTLLLGAYATDAAQMQGISSRSHHAWMERGRKYEEALETGAPVDPTDEMYYDYMVDCEAARAEARVVAVMAISKAIRNPEVPHPGYKPAIEFLRRTDPANWDQLGAHRIELTGQGGGPVQFEVGEMETRLSGALSEALPRLREIAGKGEDILDAEVVDDAGSYRLVAGGWEVPSWEGGPTTTDDDGNEYIYALWHGR